MEALESPDREPFAATQSEILVDDALFFLRNIENYTETAIQVATNDQLKMLAQKFCRRNSGYCFSEESSFDSFEVSSEAVFKIFQDLRVDLLNKIRLRKPVRAIHASSPASSGIVKASRKSATKVRIPLHTSQSKTRTSRRYRQGPDLEERESGTHARELQDVNLCHNSVAEKGLISQDRDENQSRDMFSDRKGETRPESQSLDERHRTSQIVKESMNTDSFAASGINQKLLEENNRLQVEIQTLHAYGTFIRTSLRVCYDTYLEETLAAKRACVYQKALQCNAVVETLKDLQSDLDPECFQSHYLRYGSAPPSRYWLDGVQKREQMYSLSRERAG